jgi:hypothetical protein
MKMILTAGPLALVLMLVAIGVVHAQFALPTADEVVTPIVVVGE